MGGQFGTGAGTDLSFANIIVMKDTVARASTCCPTWCGIRHFSRRRSIGSGSRLSGLRVSLEDPDYVANAVFDRLVYGFNPYGLPGNGTPESVQRIGRDDL